MSRCNAFVEDDVDACTDGHVPSLQRCDWDFLPEYGAHSFGPLLMSVDEICSAVSFAEHSITERGMGDIASVAASGSSTSKTEGGLGVHDAAGVLGEPPRRKIRKVSLEDVTGDSSSLDDRVPSLTPEDWAGCPEYGEGSSGPLLMSVEELASASKHARISDDSTASTEPETDALADADDVRCEVKHVSYDLDDSIAPSLLPERDPQLWGEPGPSSFPDVSLSVFNGYEDDDEISSMLIDDELPDRHETSSSSAPLSCASSLKQKGFVEKVVNDIHQAVRCVRLRESTVDDDDISAPNLSYSRLKLRYVFEKSFGSPDHVLRSGVYVDAKSLIARCDLEDLVSKFPHFTVNHLKGMLSSHNIHFSAHARKEDLLTLALNHVCNDSCMEVCYLFSTRCRARQSQKRKNDVTVEKLQQTLTTRKACKSTSDNRLYHRRKNARTDAQSTANPLSFPRLQSRTERNNIIREWQDLFCPQNVVPVVCASCGQNKQRSDIRVVDSNKINLSLLRNPLLPDFLLPNSYNLEAYDRAILHPRGLLNPHSKGDVNLCLQCCRCLTAKSGASQPLDSLANFQYYATDLLPPRVKDAFDAASVFDLMLICRNRCSKITHLFVKNENSSEFGKSPLTSQRYNYGNVAIVPQDVMNLRNILPPPSPEIEQSMCALFIGGKEKPTKDNIKKLSPVLVSKNRVQTMLEFLVSNNYWYKGANVSISAENISNLYAEGSTDPAEVPSSIEIGHLASHAPCNFANTVTDAVGVTSDYTHRRDCQSDAQAEEFLMEAVGYTANENNSLNYQKMKANALSWCLQGKKFVQVRGASKLVRDDDPGLLSFAFPHLDPWGIGGFHEPKRTKSQKISFERQVSNLLKQADSPFEKDPNFAFICWNIIQKAKIRQTSCFSIKSGTQRDIVQDLQNLGPDLEKLAQKWDKNKNAKPDTDKEKRAFALLNKVKVLNRDLHNSMGYKLCRRNEIRALIKKFSTPTLFITINPSDCNNPLVPLLAGKSVLEWQAMTEFQRMAFISKRPAVVAKFFDLVMNAFINIVLKYNNGVGFFGKCNAYYGMVETQGKGTLHCHMLVWIDGNPDPETLRSRLVEDAIFKQDMFTWLERNIMCHLHDFVSETVVKKGEVLQRPALETDIDPRAMTAPQIKDFSSEDEFENAFQTFVKNLALASNWHSHTESCWKYLDDNDPHDDDHCRFRVNGETRSSTELDPESLSILLRRLHPRINNYNDLILFLVQCNMDIKYIGSGEAAKALVFYITDYITKQTLPTHVGFSALQYALTKNNEKYNGDLAVPEATKNRSMVTKIVNQLAARQEMPHQQIMSYLVGGGDYYTSHSFKNLKWKDFAEFLSSDATQIDSVSDGCTLTITDGDITVQNNVLDYVMRGDTSGKCPFALENRSYLQ